MAPRAGSRGDLPAFGRRAFLAAQTSAGSSEPEALPRFVSTTPSLASAAAGLSSAEDRARRPSTQVYASLGARSLPCRPQGLQATLATASTIDDLSRPRHVQGYAAPGQLQRDRSRSPAGRRIQPSLPGLRHGAPGRLGHQPPQSLETVADRAKALDDLTDGFYATSSASAVRARRTCYTRLLSLWGVAPLPLSVDKVLWLAAGLKARRYRSAASVLSQIRVDAERGGQDISSGLRRTFADAARSCRRGLGPVVSARPLDFEAMRALPTAPEPWRPHGPIGPASAMVVGAWWLLRETEAANLRAAHVTFANTRGVLTVELLLPASKGDQEARWGLSGSSMHLHHHGPAARLPGPCGVAADAPSSLPVPRALLRRRPAPRPPILPADHGGAVYQGGVRRHHRGGRQAPRNRCCIS